MKTLIEKLPNFFIVGAPRSGTTSLYSFLKEIPEIFMSPVKEPQYFAPNFPKNDGLKPILDKKKYLKLFAGVKNEIAIGEASTSYLWDPKTPGIIHSVIPNARIIVMLRDPVERAFSHYLIHIFAEIENLSFKQAIKKIMKDFDSRTSNRYLHGGLYSDQIKRYLDTFGSKKLKIIIFEEFIEDPKTAVQNICNFLGVPFEINDFENKAYNPYRSPKGKLSKYIKNNSLLRKISRILPISSRNALSDKLITTFDKPIMKNEEKFLLQKYYENDVKKLKILLNRDLPWNNFKRL